MKTHRPILIGPRRLVITAALLGSSLLLSTAPPRTHAAEPQAVTSSTEALLADFVRASEGDSALIEPTAHALRQLSQKYPSDVVLMAYAGSATAMRATTTFWPWKKMAFADEGLAMLDKSLALLTPAHAAPIYRGTPAVLDVKFTAANTFLALPGFFNRKNRGLKLLAEVASSPLLKSSPPPFQAAVLTTQQRMQGK
ncbi:MAG: hypothetical protein AB3X41_05895 [Leptothrix ochracea]|uniref:hypothetical protein n=1 Tax=Leptothrix ochracea TaxID=735331 RepID=UPI0034E26971